MHEYPLADTETYPIVKKAVKKSHESAIVGLHTYKRGGQHILVSVGYDALKTWTLSMFGDEVDLTPQIEVAKHRCSVQSCDFSPSGNVLVVDGMNVLYVYQPSAETGSYDCEIVERGLMQIAFGRFFDDDTVFSVSMTDGLQTFGLDGSGPKSAKTNAKPLSVSAVDFSPSKKWLITGLDNGNAHVYHGRTFEFAYALHQGHKRKIRVVKFTADEEHVLLGSSDSTLSLHVLLDGTSSRSNTYSYHTSDVLSADFDGSPTSDLFASASADTRVVLWQTQTSTPLHVFHACYNEDLVTCVKFVNNGHYLLSGTAGGHIVGHLISLPIQEEPVPVVDLVNEEVEEEIHGDEENEAPPEHLPSDLSDSDDAGDGEGDEDGHAATTAEVGGGDTAFDEAINASSPPPEPTHTPSTPRSPDADAAVEAGAGAGAEETATAQSRSPSQIVESGGDHLDHLSVSSESPSP